MISIRLISTIISAFSMLLSATFGQEGRTIEVDTPIGVLQFIHVPHGRVQVGRQVGMMETIFRSVEPKRLNEGPIKMVEVEKDYWLMRKKITNKQYAHFLNEVSEKSDDFLNSDYQATVYLKDNRYLAKDDTANEPAGCVSLNGAEALAINLSKSTGLCFRLPSEAEFLLASVGTDPKMPIQYAVNRSNKHLQSYGKWSNGFEGFLSPIGEWTTDENSNGERLLKRCLSSLYEREYCPRGAEDGSLIYGVRLVIESANIEQNDNVRPSSNKK